MIITVFLMSIISSSFSRPLFLTSYLTKEKLEVKINNYKIEKGVYNENDPSSLILNGLITFKLNDVSYELVTDKSGRVETETLDRNLESYKLLESLIDLYKSEGFTTNDGYNKEVFDNQCCHTVGLYIKKSANEIISLDIDGHWSKNDLGHYLYCTLRITYMQNLY